MVDAAKRPITLIRCPQGRAKKCFFQKHDTGSMGEHVKHVPIVEKKGGSQDYLYVDDVRGHPRLRADGDDRVPRLGQSRIGKVEHPDRLVFDLDPDVGLDFKAVREAAVRLRELLADLGLKTFPLLTGGKGLHVVAPLDASADWGAVTSFAERFSRAVAEAEPERFTANMRKVQRTGPDLPRLAAQPARLDRGAALFGPRARRRAGVGAGRLGRARPI